MFIIGLTGGMGSGKSTIADFFTDLKVSVYNCDKQSHKLMEKNQLLKFSLIKHFGKQSYKKNKLNNSFLAKKVFNNINALKILNSLVHPIVDYDFKSWIKFQKGLYCIREAAILFESGSYIKCDFIISVISSYELRIQRIINRSNLSRIQILNRLNHQWRDQDLYSRSDIIIENKDNLKVLRKKVKLTHIKILNLIKKNALIKLFHKK